MFSVDAEVAVGKFYATVLIQDCFRRFAKKKFEREHRERMNMEAANSITLHAGLRWEMGHQVNLLSEVVGSIMFRDLSELSTRPGRN